MVTGDADLLNLAGLVKSLQTHVVFFVKIRLLHLLQVVLARLINSHGLEPLRFVGIHNSIFGEHHKHGTFQSGEASLVLLRHIVRDLVVQLG